MPQGDKSAYTDKQKRMARHIEKSYEKKGVSEDEAADTVAEVRRRDAARLDLQVTGGLTAGRALMRGNAVTNPDGLVHWRM